MTNRRSLQTADARQSRQTQFVPGHVGGRVASAQPVRYRRRIGSSSQRQFPLEALYLSMSSDETIGGGIYGPVPIPWDITMDTTGLGTITGLPLIAVVGADAWLGLTPPSGWTKLFEWDNGGLHCVSVWKLDAYAGEGFTGQATDSVEMGSGGANFRYRTLLIVGGTPGAFTATTGTPGTSLIATAPEATYRLQVAETQVPTSASWTPSLPYSRLVGSFYTAILANTGTFTEGWQSQSESDAIMKDRTLASGTYVPSIAESNYPINITWTG